MLEVFGIFSMGRQWSYRLMLPWWGELSETTFGLWPRPFELPLFCVFFQEFFCCCTILSSVVTPEIYEKKKKQIYLKAKALHRNWKLASAPLRHQCIPVYTSVYQCKTVFTIALYTSVYKWYLVVLWEVGWLQLSSLHVQITPTHCLVLETHNYFRLESTAHYVQITPTQCLVLDTHHYFRQEGTGHYVTLKKVL